MTKPVAWSYSALQQFLTCGKQYNEVRVLKNYKEASEHLLWGERVHSYMESALWRHVGARDGDRSGGRRGRGVDGGERGQRDVHSQQLGRGSSGATGADGIDRSARSAGHTGNVDHHGLPAGIGLPADFTAYEPIAQRFAATKGLLTTERQLAITSSFQPTEWFASDVWCRGVLDACWIDGAIARVVDWKTGKRKPDSIQLMLFALLLFAHHPEVNRVNTAFVWLQTGKMDTEKFHRKDVPKLWQDILPNVRRLEYAHKTQTWIPKPSGICRGWCPVKTCHFWDGAKSESLKGAA